MADKTTTLWDEFLLAARGSWALLRGDRTAPQFFDFSRRGLYGSFIALSFSTVFNAVLPLLLGAGRTAGPLGLTLIAVAIVYVLQIAFSALALKQMQRLDGLVPYIVADNWNTVLLVLLAAALLLVGVPAEPAVLVIGLVGLVIKINVARLIVTLSPWQVAIFLVSQLVGGGVGLFVLGAILPPVA